MCLKFINVYISSAFCNFWLNFQFFPLHIEKKLSKIKAFCSNPQQICSHGKLLWWQTKEAPSNENEINTRNVVSFALMSDYSRRAMHWFRLISFLFFKQWMVLMRANTKIRLMINEKSNTKRWIVKYGIDIKLKHLY